jgi:hypothetical protein
MRITARIKFDLIGQQGRIVSPGEVAAWIQEALLAHGVRKAQTADTLFATGKVEVFVRDIT